MNFKKGETIIYPQHGACIVLGTKKMEAFGEKREYLILQTVINEMTLKVPVDKAEEVGVRPPVSADELEDLVAVLSKPDPRVPSNWSRRFKNHQEKLKSGDVYQVAEVVRNLAARNRDASLSAAERTMYERARVNLVSEISPALKVSAEDAEAYLDQALAKGVLKPPKEAGGEAEVAAARPPVSSMAATSGRPDRRAGGAAPTRMLRGAARHQRSASIGDRRSWSPSSGDPCRRVVPTGGAVVGELVEPVAHLGRAAGVGPLAGDRRELVVAELARLVRPRPCGRGRRRPPARAGRPWPPPGPGRARRTRAAPRGRTPRATP